MNTIEIFIQIKRIEKFILSNIGSGTTYLWSHLEKYHKDTYIKLKGKDTLQAELIPINNGNFS